MLYFSAIFDEFDREYSFILTTNQIKLNTRLENGQRTDIKSDFEEENIKYSEISTLQKEYIKLTEEYRGLSSTFANSPLILNQKQTALNIKRSQTFNEIKSKTTLFLKKLCVSLQKLINDYNGERILLQNGDDLLYFQADIGDIRKFEKVKIINAIAATFSFASGIEYYLNYDKLSQKGLFIEEEKKEDKEDKENNQIEESKIEQNKKQKNKNDINDIKEELKNQNKETITQKIIINEEELKKDYENSIRYFIGSGYTRCFGMLSGADFGLIPNPEINECDLKAGKVRFAVLGNDTFWKILTEPEIRFISFKYTSNKDNIGAVKEIWDLIRQKLGTNSKILDKIGFEVIYFDSFF
jgi:hypothetical protein